jgi:hypothetical protein
MLKNKYGYLDLAAICGENAIMKSDYDFISGKGFGAFRDVHLIDGEGYGYGSGFAGGSGYGNGLGYGGEERNYGANSGIQVQVQLIRVKKLKN